MNLKYPNLASLVVGARPFHYDIAPEVRALSWKEPYASLMLFGKIETRVWPTPYRGLVLICTSAAGYSPEQFEKISGRKQVSRIAERVSIEDFEKSPLGHAIAIAELVDCRQMTPLDEDACFVQYREPWVEWITNPITEKQRRVEKRLWCHVYANVRRIEPFAWKGAQRWKQLSAEQKQRIVIAS